MATSFEEFRLPPGRHGLPPEQVHANQRWRLYGACAEVLARDGYAALTVEAVARTASVSKAAFYHRFDGILACVLATYEMAAASALRAIQSACSQEAAPENRVSAALAGLFECLCDEPALARVLTDLALDDVPGLAHARAEFTDRCARLLAASWGEPAANSDRDRRLAAAAHLVRGAHSWIFLRFRAEGADPALEAEMTRLLSSLAHPRAA